MPIAKAQGRARGSKVVRDEAVPSSEVRGDLLDNEIQFDVSPKPDPSGEARNILVAKSPSERAVVAIKSPEAEKQLRELVAKSADIKEVTNADGREQIHRMAMDLKNARVAIKNAGETAREDANAFSRAVIAEVARLTAISQEEETRVFKLRDDYDAKVKAEKEEAERKVRELVAQRRAKIDAIANLPRTLAGASSAQLVEELQKLVAMQPTAEEFDSMLAEMLLTIETVGSALSALLQGARDREEAECRRIEEQEAERVRLARQAEENARKAAELAAQQAEIERQRAAQAEAERIARVVADQQREAMDHINVMRSKAETTATGARALSDALEYVETVATGYNFGTFASMVQMARGLACDTLRARIKAAVEGELPQAWDEAYAENARMDADRRAVAALLNQDQHAHDAEINAALGFIDFPNAPDFAAMDEPKAPAEPDDAQAIEALRAAVRTLRKTRNGSFVSGIVLETLEEIEGEQ